MDVLAKREGVLRDIEDKKNQIREAKGTTIYSGPNGPSNLQNKFVFFSAWLQNGLMTVLGFGVMVYLQNAEAMG